MLFSRFHSPLPWALSLLLAWSAAAGAAGAPDSSLTLGAGIAAPSVASAFFENPSGLAHATGARLLGAADTDSTDPLGVVGLLLQGTGSVGAALGLQNFTGIGRTGGTSTMVDWGLAAELPGSRLALGTAGNLSTSGGSSFSDIALGASINPRGPVRLGVSAFDITSSTWILGAGIADDISPEFSVALDGESDSSWHGLTIKPGMAVRIDKVQLSVGWGLELDDSGRRRIPSGGTIGLGLELSQSLVLQGYYNQFAKYYAGFTARL
jgi:hypothetical protein